MNYRLINKFKNIGEFHIENEKILYVQNDIIWSYFNQEILKLNEYWGIYFGKNIINVFTNKSSNTFYDYEGKEIHSFNKINIYHIFFKDEFIYYDRNEKQTKYKSVILFDGKIGKNFIDREQLFFVNDIFIKSNNYKNGNILWHFNIQNIPNQQPDWEVKKIIGVLENKLWVALNHHTIVALDIQTGALLHQLRDIPNFQCAWLPSAIPEPEATQIDEKNNKLIGFMWEFYWEINPTNGEIQFWDLSEEFLSQKIRNDISKFVLTDEKIYFASHFDSKIASFDRKTKKIEWFYHFEKENEKTPRIMEIQGNDQKIGALSSAGLCTFLKERKFHYEFDAKKFANQEKIIEQFKKMYQKNAKEVFEANPNLFNKDKNSKFVRDEKTLNKLIEYLSPKNANKLDAIDGEEELIKFLKKHNDAPCGNCENLGHKIFGGRTLDEMLENYVEVKYAFRNHSDLWRKIEMGALNTNAAVREGTQHMLDVFKKNPNKYDPDKIEGLDLQFEEILDDICKNCRYDVKFKQVNNEQLPLFAEFKSYNTDTWANIKNSNKFIKQFKRYLQEKDITKMDDLAYIINERKANINEVKQAFKELFNKEKEEIFKVMNSELRQNLFGKFSEENQMKIFEKMIQDNNTQLYNFIKL